MTEFNEDNFYEDKRSEIQWDDTFEQYAIYTDEKKISDTKENQKEFISNIESYTELINNERKGREGLLSGIQNIDELRGIQNKELDRNFYYIKKSDFDSFFVIGDLHGSKESLKKVIKETDLFNKVQKKRERNVFIFLGDYIDRGAESLWVLFHALKLKISFPGNVILLRGNHEFFEEKNEEFFPTASPADTFDRISNAKIFDNKEKLSLEKAKGLEDLYSKEFKKSIFGDFFNNLPQGVFIELLGPDNNLFISHSGYPKPSIDPDWDKLKESNFDYFRFVNDHGQKMADRFPDIISLGDLNENKHLESLSWTRFTSENYRSCSGSGRGKEIGVYSQNNFMDKFGISTVLRGHKHPEEGFSITKYPRDEQDFEIYNIFSGGGFEDSGEDFKNYCSGYVKFDKESLQMKPQIYKQENLKNENIEKKEK